MTPQEITEANVSTLRTRAPRGWVQEVADCVRRIPKSEFTLDDLKRFEDELSQLYPENRHIPEKIRQTLQILRDRGDIEFLGRGCYRKRSQEL